MRTHIKTAALAVALVVGATGAFAQTWPERPIQLIVPFPAGSATDTVARILGPFMGEHLGQPIVIENRPGASGAIGMQAVAEAAPDGYMIGLATTSTLAVAPALNPNLTYDPETDFAPIGMIGISPYVLVVAQAVDAESVDALVEMARETPNRLRYASVGPASLAHLAGALFAEMADVELTHIPYRTSAQSVVDLAAGRVDMQFGTIPPVLPHLQAGSVDLLAVTGSERIALFPDTPTLAELGFEGYDVGLWMALVAPDGTSDEVTSALNAALNAALGDPTIAAQLETQGQTPVGGDPDFLSTRITTEIGTWRQVGERSGIIAQ